MASLQTKFGVGDQVWIAETNRQEKRRPCPDCHGSRKWAAVSPAGTWYSMPCPRCNANYQSNDALSLTYVEFEPGARQATISKVDHWESSVPNHSGEVSETRYMCDHSGTHSGQTYDNNRVFATEEEALTVARVMCANQNVIEWVKTLYDRALKYSDYELDNAILQSAKELSSQTRIAYDWLISDLRGAYDWLALEEQGPAVTKWLDDFEADISTRFDAALGQAKAAALALRAFREVAPKAMASLLKQVGGRDAILLADEIHRADDKARKAIQLIDGEE